jgi:hypothetical protein
MRKRISLLIMAAIMALTMSLGGATAAFADTKLHPNKSPACEKDQGGDNKNCPGKRR